MKAVVSNIFQPYRTAGTRSLDEMFSRLGYDASVTVAVIARTTSALAAAS